MSGAVRTGRVDLHIHSWASNVTDYYTANVFAIPESYSDPLATWRELRAQGMCLVTLTDHNSIDGVKAMLDRGLPSVFVSSELTATFPEDGCNIHVTVANVTEAQFAEANRLRGNLYDLLDYLEREIAAEAQAPGRNQIAYWMTHPLMSTQNRPYGREGALTLAHIEKALLLFPCLEARNGTRTRSLNELTHRLLSSLDRDTIERLANRHGIVPRGRTPWLKTLVAGSDDHSGLNQGRTWTEFPLPVGRAAVPNDLVQALRNRATVPMGAHGGPVTLAHAMVKLLYDGSQRGTGGAVADGGVAAGAVGLGGPLQALLRIVFASGSLRWHERLRLQGGLWWQKLLDRRAPRRGQRARPFEQLLTTEVRRLLGEASFRREMLACERTDDRIFLVVSTLLDRLFQRYVARLRGTSRGDLVCLVKEVVALVTSNLFVSLPYLLSYLHQSSDRQLVRDVHQGFAFTERQKLVLVTDTFFEVNGVARTIRRMIDAAAARGIDFTVVTCLHDDERAALCADPAVQAWLQRGQLVILPAVVAVDLPEYQGLQVRIPSFLGLLRFLQEGGFTKMQISTPGVVGLAGLCAAKLLQIETASTYHTSFPEYVENYTRDISLEALTWKYMVLFYHAVDEVVVPSKFIAQQLHQRGLRKRKLLVLDRWVDTEQFQPRHRRPGFWNERGLAVPDGGVVFLYVGRVGLEKNLQLLAEAFLELHARRPEVRLAVVGDGPFRAELERLLAGRGSVCTGFLGGAELAAAYASADVKLFPSTTDTWGNAPLEAQASGLPVVVSDQGGPQELMVDGVTGFRVPGRDRQALLAAMERLLDAELRAAMGRAARAFTEQHRVVAPFSAILDAEGYRRSVRQRRAAQRLPDLEPDEPVSPPVEAFLVDHRVPAALEASA